MAPVRLIFTLPLAVISFVVSCLCNATASAGTFDFLPAGHWYEMPDSRLDSVAPDPVPPGTAGTKHVMNSWSGGAFDSTNDRLIIWGGGHHGYAGNEVYAFNVSGGTGWTRLSEPSTDVECDTDINEYPDGNPCSAHTYDYVEYHPGTHSFVLLGSASPYPIGGGGGPTPHLFSLATNTWRAGPDRDDGSTLQGASSAYDPNRNVIWVLPCYGQRLAQFNPNANGNAGEWTQYEDISIAIDAVSAIDPGRDLLVTVEARSSKVVIVRDLSNPSIEQIVVNTAGDYTAQNTSKSGFEWDPVGENFVAWIGGTSVYTLTPPDGDWRSEDWLWARVDAAPDNAVTPTEPNANGTYFRWRYVPSENVFVVVNRTDENVFVYRMGKASALPPKPPVDLLPPPPLNDQDQGSDPDWEIRSNASGVIHALNFDTEESVIAGSEDTSGLPERVSWEQQIKLSGAGSLRIDILKEDDDTAGNWRTYLSPFDQRAFTEGDEYWVQYRAYIPKYLATHPFTGNGGSGYGGGWKTSIISWFVGSSTDNNVVINNNEHRGYVQGYNNGSAPNEGWAVLFDSACRFNDWRHQSAVDHSPGLPLDHGTCEEARARFGGLYSYVKDGHGPAGPPDPLTGAVVWPQDGWITILQHVRIGNFNQPNSLIEAWAAHDGDDYTLLFSNGTRNFGSANGGHNALWLTPYHTGKISDPSQEDTFILYDEVIVSANFIPAPGLSAGTEPAPKIDFSASPVVVDSGYSTTLTWTVNNADACIADGAWQGEKAPSGSEMAGPLSIDSQFDITCSNASGETTRSVTVEVNDPVSNPEPVLEVIILPRMVTFGGSARLQWASENASTCVASDAWTGQRPLSGSKLITNIRNHATYMLSCFNENGRVNKSATVRVGNGGTGFDPE